MPHLKSERARAFAGDGIDFGHLAFGKIDLEVVFAQGHADITRFVVESEDLSLALTVHLELATAFEQAKIDGCVRFKPSEALATRAPKTAALLATTGAPLAPDGMYTIKLEGTLADMKRLGTVCGPPPR
jgi:hypothetical protein